MKNSVSASWEMQQFQSAFREYLTEARKDAGEETNRRAVNISFKASKEMPTAIEVRANILKDHPKESALWNALATGKTRLGVSKFGSAVRGKGNKKIAEAIFKSRGRHAGYSRYLFLDLASDLGAKVRAVKKLSSIKNAKGTKASEAGKADYVRAVLEILGVDSEHGTLLDKAIAQAMIGEADDMRKYLGAKLAKRAKAHSGKGR